MTLYRHLYIKYIGITYNITYKGSLYFGIPGVYRFSQHRLHRVTIKINCGTQPDTDCNQIGIATKSNEIGIFPRILERLAEIKSGGGIHQH